MTKSEYEKAQEAEQRRICRAIIAGLMMAKGYQESDDDGLLAMAKYARRAADALLAELERTEKEP